MVKDRQCEYCKVCKEFFNLEQTHLHRVDETPTNRRCLNVAELKSKGWRMSSGKIWSKS